MFNDLFTMFDYTWGTGFTFMMLSMWFGGLLLPFFVFSFMVYWYAPNAIESILMDFVFMFSSKMPEEVKWTGGTPHVFSTLLLLMLILNLSGGFPYHYPLSCHFLLVGSLAVPFWFGTIFMNFSFNWRLLFVGFIQEGGYFIPNIMVIFSEVTSILARPLTLTCRLVMNIIIGQIIITLISNTSLSIFYSFFWYDHSFGKVDFTDEETFILTFITGIFIPTLLYSIYVTRHVIIISIVGFLMMVEFAVGFLQACIFTGLLVFYVYEAPVKLKEETNYKLYSNL